MADIILYLIKSLLAGALFFIFYQFAMRRESYLQLNRFYLLTVAVLILVLPLTGSILPFSLFSPDADNTLPVINLSEVVITAGRIMSPEQQEAVVNWTVIGYSIITFAMIGGLIVSVFRILKFYRSAIRAEKLENNIYLVQENGSPFSFLGRVFISREYAQHPDLKNILAHENAHIRQKHMVDLLFLELLSCVLWFNPFFFLIKRAMREVHEYLADREVIQQGAEPISYQQLLFNEVSGNPEYIIANNFNLLTKKRIIMLIKKSKKSAALRIGVLMPFILTAAFVIAMIQGNSLLAQIQPPPPPPPSQAPPPPPPPPPHPQDKEKAVSPQKKTTEKGSAVKKESQVKYVAPVVPGQAKNGKQDEPVFTVVENPPKYPGGDDARIKYMVGSMKYPEVARTKGIQGTVYVTFIIETDGAVSNVKILRGVGGGCDEEAQRVVSEMPKWIPGTQDGKAVRVQYNLPISFRLGDGKESKQTEKK